MFSRKCSLFYFSVLAAVAFAALSHDPSLAAKPGGSRGGNTGGGAIYFVSSGFRRMNSDGSGKTLLTTLPDEPSRQLHAGRRWFLRVDAATLAGIVPWSTTLLWAEPDIGGHDWSPDGTRIVYDLQTTNELWVADLVAEEVALLHAGPANLAVWSPDGTKIAFHEAVFLGDILIINPDGTGLTRIVRSHGGKAVSVNIPHWSPSGSHLIFQQWHHNGFAATSYVYRAKADGSGKSNLTSPFDFATPIGWR